MKGKTIWILLILLIAALGVWYFANRSELTESEAAAQTCYQKCVAAYDACWVEKKGDTTVNAAVGLRSKADEQSLKQQYCGNVFNACLAKCPKGSGIPIDMSQYKPYPNPCPPNDPSCPKPTP